MRYDNHKLYIDFSKTTGPIKPMNGINNGPKTVMFSQDATRFFREAGIPFSRLHDTEYPFGSGEFVDVNCIFKNFNRDADDPSAYNFMMTDRYMKAIQESGAKVIYRLGCTIEHQKTKQYIFPPKDFSKWAQICEHIIRHYNEGWNNGFHMNVEFWEIWNEPDGILWEADNREFYRLYKEVSTYLKKCHPNIKIGGPALCQGANEFAEDMMAYLTEGERAPMDFYSWHTYCCTPEEMRRQAAAARDLMERYGYTDALSIIDEWNYVIDWFHVSDSHDVVQSMKGAAFSAAIMSVLQDSATDIATYYDGALCCEKTWNGLFSKGKIEHIKEGEDFYLMSREVKVKKGYYPFKAFHTLMELGTQVRTVSYNMPDVFVTAATDGKDFAVMMTNFNDTKENTVVLRPVLTNAPAAASKLYLLDENHDLSLIAEMDEFPECIELAPNSVLLWTSKD